MTIATFQKLKCMTNQEFHQFYVGTAVFQTLQISKSTICFTGFMKRARDVEASYTGEPSYKIRKKIQMTDDMKMKELRKTEQGDCEIRNCPCPCHNWNK